MTTPAAPATSPATTPETGAPPASAAPAAPAEPPAPKPVAPPENETPEQRIERLEAELKKANSTAATAEAKARVNAKTAAAEEARKELAQQIGKALGLVEDETPDPAKLTEQVSTATAEARQAKVELAVFHAAAAAGADAVALLDSRTFMTRLADLDPSDAAAVTTAITEAVKVNPSFAVAPATRLPAPNPALGSSAHGAPDAAALIEAARAKGDWKTVIALENQKLTNPQPQR